MNKFSSNTLFFFLLITFTTSVNAYVINRSGNDSLVHWPSNVSLIDVYVNSANSLGLNSTDILTIADDSFAQWNTKSRITINRNTTSGSGRDNFNEIYFSLL